MSRISRLVVLMTSLAAVVGAMAGTAGAVTWHVTTSGTFTATAPSGTLSATGNLICPSASATGSYTAGSFNTPVYSGVSGTVHFSGCNLAGQNTSVTCGYVLTASEQPVTTTLTTGNADFTCGATLVAGGTKLCHIEGSAHFIYHDRPVGADTLTITTSSSLRTTNGTANCPLGANDIGHLSETTFTVTSGGGNGPHIHRTA